MVLSSLEKACPECLGNLHYEDTTPHPDRQGYDIHTYRCLSCGPTVAVTQLSDEAWLSRWGGPIMPITGLLNGSEPNLIPEE